MGKIKSVIFDWGGVLIDDPGPAVMQYCAEALSVSGEDFTKAYHKLAADFQKGNISEDAFWDHICSRLSVSKPKLPSLWGQAIESAYRPKEEMFSLARSLHQSGYRIGLLSNTEKPAMKYFHRQGYDMFDALVFSCAEGTAKPEKKIYELALEKLRVGPNQAVFIDDRADYIAGAREVGLNTILFQSIEQVRNKLTLLRIKTGWANNIVL